jgi:hypothetical protein
MRTTILERQENNKIANVLNTSDEQLDNEIMSRYEKSFNQNTWENAHSFLRGLRKDRMYRMGRNDF